jgi:hypothetical protein
MPDFEERLRTTLTAIADELPPERGARAELDRRLADRRRRGPLLAAAAALVLIAAVAVPVVLSRDSAPTGKPTGTPPPSTGTVPPARVAHQFLIGEFTTDEGPRMAVGYVDDVNYCTAVVADWPSADRADFTCIPLRWEWPEDQPRGVVFSSLAVNGHDLNDRGPLPHKLVFITDPRVRTMSARRGDGTGVGVHRVGGSAGGNVFLADFGGPVDGFGYTAYDGDGNVLENAIT